MQRLYIVPLCSQCNHPTQREPFGGASTSAVSRLIDNRFAIEMVQQLQGAVLSHLSVDGHPGTGRSAGLILGYGVTSGEAATEQCNAVAARDVVERGANAPAVNEEGHGLAAGSISMR